MLSLRALSLLAIFPTVFSCAHHSAQPVEDIVQRDQIPASSLKKTAIENVRVFDGYHLRNSARVVIDHGVIGDPLDTTNIHEVIQGDGRVLLPGLIDSHIHMADITSLEALSSYGVTTAFNMNCMNYTACDILKQQTGLTSIFSAGSSAIGPGTNHARLINPPKDLLVTSPAQAPELVSWTFGNGSDYFKIVSEPHGPTIETQMALVEETHKRGKTSSTHASYIAEYKIAVESRTDSIQHTAADAPMSCELFDAIKARSQFVTPTITIFKQSLKNATTIEWLTGSPETNQTVAQIMKNVAAMREAGVPMLAGTDAVGVHGPIDLPFGETLHWELESLVEAGFTEAEALRAATVEPAKWHKVFDRGVIKPGKRADLVLLNSDPLQDIKNTRDIAKVWIGGREYESRTQPGV